MLATLAFPSPIFSLPNLYPPFDPSFWYGIFSLKLKAYRLMRWWNRINFRDLNENTHWITQVLRIWLNLETRSSLSVLVWNYSWEANRKVFYFYLKDCSYIIINKYNAYTSIGWNRWHIRPLLLHKCMPIWYHNRPLYQSHVRVFQNIGCVNSTCYISGIEYEVYQTH